MYIILAFVSGSHTNWILLMVVLWAAWGLYSEGHYVECVLDILDNECVKKNIKLLVYTPNN